MEYLSAGKTDKATIRASGEGAYVSSYSSVDRRGLMAAALGVSTESVLKEGEGIGRDALKQNM
jgi:hypothetical protein